MPGWSDDTPENHAATRLLKARVAAGFTAGINGAAAFHGWDAGRYGTDEAGRKAIPAERVSVYARSFRVDPAWLAAGTLPPEADTSEAAVRTRLVDPLHRLDVSAVFIGLQGPSTSLREAGVRLRESRRAAGFSSAREATERFGWRPGTYGPHEHPCRRLHSEACLVYAFAFGVEPEWLLLGERHSPGISRHDGTLPSKDAVATYTARVRAAMAAYVEARRPGPHVLAPDDGPGPGGKRDGRG